MRDAPAVEKDSRPWHVPWNSIHNLSTVLCVFVEGVVLRTFFGVAALALTIAVAGPASAQSQQKWNGPYIGANLGYGWADVDGGITVLNPQGVPYATGPMNYNIEPEGMFGGIQAGINKRNGGFFAGIEADFQGADISGSSTTSFAPPNVFPFTYAASASLDWFATVRGRLGIATDSMLLYVTGGIAVGDVDYSATYLINGNKATAHLQSSDTQVGYVLGAGMELALRSNWSVKLEYQYLNFGDQQAHGFLPPQGCDPAEKVSTKFDTDIHTVRIGLNYHFQSTPPRHDPLKP